MTVPSLATECSCRPDILADSTGTGTCTKTQDGKNWCKLDWNSGGSAVAQSTAEQLKKSGINIPDLVDPFGRGGDPITRASNVLLDQKGLDDLPAAVGILLAAALVRNAPDRLDLYQAYIKRFSNKEFSTVLNRPGDKSAEETISTNSRTYSARFSFGCAQFNDGSFVIAVRTLFARPGPAC